MNVYLVIQEYPERFESPKVDVFTTMEDAKACLNELEKCFYRMHSIQEVNKWDDGNYIRIDFCDTRNHMYPFEETTYIHIEEKEVRHYLKEES